MRIRLRHVLRDVDRYGVVRFYFRRHKGEKKIRLPDDENSPEFLARYHELRTGFPGVAAHAPVGRSTLLTGTFRWLVAEHLKSLTFKRLGSSTQVYRRQVLDSVCQEPVHHGAAETFATFPLDRLTLKSLRVLRDRKAGLPEAANYRVKVLRQLFRWAVDQDHMPANPAHDLTRIEHHTQGHHTWTPDEVARFERRHPVGVKARLALALLLWTGLRRSDVILLGKQHVRDGSFKLLLTKNRARKPVTVEAPLLPELQRIIATSPCGELTYLVNNYGRPFTVAGFGNWFRDRCVEAGVPGRAHGLRKAGAATAAENGATPHQLMAIFGWLTLREAERYAREASRKRLANDAMKLLVRTV